MLTWSNKTEINTDPDDRDADQGRNGQDWQGPQVVDQTSLVRLRRIFHLTEKYIFSSFACVKPVEAA